VEPWHSDAVCAREDVRTALDRGDWATVLRAVLDTGLSQTAIATRTGLSQSQVSRLANGRTHDPGLRTVRSLCDGLAIPRTMAGLRERPGDEEGTTDRRGFLTGSAAIAACAVLPTSDLADEHLIKATTFSYRQLEQRTPSRALIQAVVAHLNLTRSLTQRASGKQRLRLAAAFSEVAGLAAWMHADLVEPTSALRLYKASITAAHESGQGLLAIYMQGSLGQYAAGTGDPISGIRIIRVASGRLPQSAPDSARAWLAALEGVALGYLGDRSALPILNQAKRYAEAAHNQDAVWPWIFPVTETKITRYRATAASRLGLPKVAARAHEQASPASGSPKQAAWDAVERARSLAISGHVDEACWIATSAFGTGQSLGSERVCQSVREFRAELATSKMTGTALAELDDRLYTSYAKGV
jgi:transcriptional regulator with XRE-family HTH domain